MKTKTVLFLVSLIFVFACSKTKTDFYPQSNTEGQVQLKKTDSIAKVGEFDGTSISVTIRSSAIDSISDYLLDEHIIDSEIDIVTIDDPAPCDTSSIPYLVIKTIDTVSNHEMYIKIIKVVDNSTNPCTVDYYLSVQAADGPPGGHCTGVYCQSCKALRNWFGGPVVGCECLDPVPGHTGYCNHTTGGNWFSLIFEIIGIIF